MEDQDQEEGSSDESMPWQIVKDDVVVIWWRPIHRKNIFEKGDIVFPRGVGGRDAIIDGGGATLVPVAALYQYLSLEIEIEVEVAIEMAVKLPDELIVQIISFYQQKRFFVAVQLPDELIVEIISFLPAKSLLRWRSVSKSWLNLMSSTKFKLMHLHNFNQLNPRYFVRRLDFYASEEWFRVHFDNEAFTSDRGTQIEFPLDDIRVNICFRILDGLCGESLAVMHSSDLYGLKSGSTYTYTEVAMGKPLRLRNNGDMIVELEKGDTVMKKH
ncbi:LOW QUALITY PROTEIN: hypothetical protein OSB04_013226 [Centaurea solstitialis]|uniref:F-box domain-containing protein n=1 Tax=Centaurea solstitialis TaxID=347529 RepID=A0AA38TVW1_9ASTR|nr:LOW QUALITY PROTEIN: hypothetical protein OSB04_013226 [Centaurea solstitialis]